MQAGDGTTVTGAGTMANPYIVSADPADVVTVADTPTVNMTKTGNVITSDVIVAPIPNQQLLEATPTGLAVTCERVQDCVGEGFDDGLIYDDVANQFRARLSTDPGNTTVFGTDGGLFSAPGAVVLGCGLETGVGGAIQANGVDFSTFTRSSCNDNGGIAPQVALDPACNLQGQGVYCDTNGELRTKPEKFTVATPIASINEALGPATIPFTSSIIQGTITNPSSCYCLCGYVSFAAISYLSSTGNANPEESFQFDLGGGGGFTGFGVWMRDTRGVSSVSQDRHRFFASLNLCLDPGETKNIQFRVDWTLGPVHAGGTSQVLASAREIRFFGTNL